MIVKDVLLTAATIAEGGSDCPASAIHRAATYDSALTVEACAIFMAHHGVAAADDTYGSETNFWSIARWFDNHYGRLPWSNTAGDTARLLREAAGTA